MISHFNRKMVTGCCLFFDQSTCPAYCGIKEGIQLYSPSSSEQIPRPCIADYTNPISLHVSYHSSILLSKFFYNRLPLLEYSMYQIHSSYHISSHHHTKHLSSSTFVFLYLNKHRRKKYLTNRLTPVTRINVSAQD